HVENEAWRKEGQNSKGRHDGGQQKGQGNGQTEIQVSTRTSGTRLKTGGANPRVLLLDRTGPIARWRSRRTQNFYQRYAKPSDVGFTTNVHPRCVPIFRRSFSRSALCC